MVFGAAAKPVQNNSKISVVQDSNDGVNYYKFIYQKGNGTVQEFQGISNQNDTRSTVIVIKGYHSVVAPENSLYEVHYVSDKNGFLPEVKIATSNHVSFGFGNGAVEGSSGQKESDGKPSKPIDANQFNIMKEGENKSNNNENSEEFPDRIGTPAIITLQG